MWPFRGEAVEEAARKLADLEHSQLVLSAVQWRQRVQQVLSGVAERVLNEPARQLVAQRLEETAAWVLESEDKESAAAAVHMAQIVRDACAPFEVGYLRTLLELSCGLARQAQRGEDEGQLILSG